MGKVSKALSKAGADVESVNAISGDPGRPPGPYNKGGGKEKDVFLSVNNSRSGWDERLVEATENLSGVVESFRRLRSKILHPSDGKPIRSILLISTSPAEGKSFVCANLGIIMAHGVGQHALMVDCDLRRPSLAGLFGVENNFGLVDHLRDGVDLSKLIEKTGQEKLSLIPAGNPPDNPSELLESHKMRALVSEVVSRYPDRLVLLDSPPALAASETAVLAQQVDKVVLLVRWGGAGREQIKKLVDQIGREKILGIVFNAFEMNILDKGMKGEGYYNYYSDEYK